jgi:hypothetical protein
MRALSGVLAGELVIAPPILAHQMRRTNSLHWPGSGVRFLSYREERVMTNLHSVALVSLIGLAAIGCATVTPSTPQDQASTAQSSCRKVASPDATIHSYCGTAEQWAEFDARTAQVDQGLSCRNVNTSHALCLYAKQWKYADSHTRAPDYGFGNEAEESARIVGYMNQGDGATALYATELAARQPDR